MELFSSTCRTLDLSSPLSKLLVVYLILNVCKKVIHLFRSFCMLKYQMLIQDFWQCCCCFTGINLFENEGGIKVNSGSCGEMTAFVKTPSCTNWPHYGKARSSTFLWAVNSFLCCGPAGCQSNGHVDNGDIFAPHESSYVCLLGKEPPWLCVDGLYWQPYKQPLSADLVGHQFLGSKFGEKWILCVHRACITDSTAQETLCRLLNESNHALGVCQSQRGIYWLNLS